MERTKLKKAYELREELVSSQTDARNIIAGLFDEGTFVELGAYVRRSADEFGKSNGDFEGVITGYGAIDSRLVFAFVQDFENEKGALTAAHAKKICNLYDMALKSRAPVVGVFNSAGAQIMEGVGALSGYGRIMKKASAAKGVIPQIAVVTGLCSGASSAIAGMFDFVIADKSAQIFVVPPFLMRGKFNEKESGTSEKAYANGTVTCLTEDKQDAVAQTRRLLGYIPSNNTDGTVYALSNDEINRLSPGIDSTISSGKYDMTAVIAAVADDGVFAELWGGYAPELLTGFVQLNSKVIGVVANQPSVKGGALSAAAARKAAKLIDFCNFFNIPLLTLVDTAGTDVTPLSENAPYCDALAALAGAYAAAGNAMVTVVLGKAYGSAFTLMGSKAIGADVAFAVDNAKISIMAPESAAEFVWEDQIKQAEDPVKKRAELVSEWSDVMASPVASAREGDIDDIISCDEMRQRVAAAFEMLSFKTGEEF